MKPNEHRGSKQKGDHGIGVAIAHYTSLGHTVCIPLTDSQPFDLVVFAHGKFSRIQVRVTCQKKIGKRGIKWVVRLCSTSMRADGKARYATFNVNAADVLFVVTNDGDCYEIPYGKLKGNKWMIVVGNKYKEFIIGE